MDPNLPPRLRIPLLVRLLSVGLVLLAVITAALAWYDYVRVTALSGRITVLESTLDSASSTLQGVVETTHATLAEEQQKASQLATQIDTVQQQFGNVTGTVNTLQKLVTTDKQLLAKYSKVYFLNENYVPAHLTVIPKDYTYHTDRDYQFLTEALPHLTAMIDNAKGYDIPIYVESAYRSFAEQKALKGEYSVVYGKGTANSFSADQGYSEHQLGTAVDLISTGQNGQLNGFEKTRAYTWLASNAYRYGFILSYPQGNAYYIYEPWHWRYVGIKLATYLHDHNINFYDMDQRDIDTYLPDLFD